ncbi:hypothetical protein QUB63_02470 [Microcoleus sp. ARI1-B5]|uniref:hypothetical protein n=1 Tax=unclassified Microcoleus TaxID=2642155 RepID=UPI002FD0CC7F
MMKIVICAYTDMARKPAERSAWGENKERYSIFVTPTAMKAIDARAEALAVSRSEFLEQFARGRAGITDSELTKEDREAMCKSPGMLYRYGARRTCGKGLVPQAQGVRRSRSIAQKSNY